MPKVCDHEIRETKKGAGPCRIEFEVYKRNGQPNWWCRTHGMPASAPDGASLESCPGAWFDPVPNDLQSDFDVRDGELAVWGVVEPALTFGVQPDEPGKVHVHHRRTAKGEKDIDRSFDIIRLRNGSRTLVVEGMAAVAFSISELAGRQVVALTCPWCHEVHIDEQKFATYPHKKHLCNSCGRNFRNRTGETISNPLAASYELLDIPLPKQAMPAKRALDLDPSRFSAFAIWPSNCAIVSTMTRPEEVGVHVHAWGDNGKQVIDETYSPVSIAGVELDEACLRMLAIQRSLAHGTPITSMDCPGCGAPLTSPLDGWVEPTTTHLCIGCHRSVRTRRRVFLNPLAEKQL